MSKRKQLLDVGAVGLEGKGGGKGACRKGTLKGPCRDLLQFDLLELPLNSVSADLGIRLEKKYSNYINGCS